MNSSLYVFGGNSLRTSSFFSLLDTLLSLACNSSRCLCPTTAQPPKPPYTLYLCLNCVKLDSCAPVIFKGVYKSSGLFIRIVPVSKYEYFTWFSSLSNAFVCCADTELHLCISSTTMQLKTPLSRSFTSLSVIFLSRIVSILVI